MKMKNKLLSVVLVLTVAIGLLPLDTLATGHPQSAKVETYSMIIEYHYDNNGNGEPVSAEVLADTLGTLEMDGVEYQISDGLITLSIAEDVLADGIFNYGRFVLDPLSDGSTLTNSGKHSNPVTDLSKNNNKPVKLIYGETGTTPAPDVTEPNAWFFIRTDGLVPMENGSTSYPGNEYLPAHNSSIPLLGTVLKESSWSENYGPIVDDTINGVKLSLAFAEVQKAIGETPEQTAIDAALSGLEGYDPETHGIMWYVVKKTPHLEDGCLGRHVDGVLYTKGNNPTEVRVLNYYSNIPGNNKLLAYAIIGLNADATVGSLIPSRTGYDFIGWNTQTDGNGISYEAGNSMKMDDDHNLYAQWTPKDYTVTYKWSNAPDALDIPANGTVKYGADYTVDTTYTNGTTITADGGTYTFSGWNKTGTITIEGNLTLTGSWSFVKDAPPVEVKTTQIEIFHFYVGGSTEDDQVHDTAAEAKLPNGGAVSRDYKGITMDYVNGLSTLEFYKDDLTTRSVEYHSYTIYAYDDNGAGGDTAIIWDGTQPLDLTNVKTLRIHLNYYQTRYNVVYNANGGVGEAVTMRYNTANDYTILDNAGDGNPNFIREGYTFTGWSKDVLGEEKVTVDDTVAALEKGATVTYYAQWSENTPPSGGGDDPTPTSRYTVTVNYLDAETNETLAESFEHRRIISGSRYDVSAEAAKEIDGYTISSVDGETSGILRRNLTINVYYAAELVEILPEEPPLTDLPGSGTDVPELDLPGEDVPLIPLPDVGSDLPGGELDIPGEDSPLGNLPQTGTTAAPVDAALTLGLLALAFSMAAGLTFTLSRKKEEDA